MPLLVVVVLIVFGYPVALAGYWLLHYILVNYTGFDMGLLKASVIAAVASLVVFLIISTPIGSFTKNQTFWSFLFVTIMEGVIFTLIFWVGSRMQGYTHPLKATLYIFSYSFVLLALNNLRILFGKPL
mgnify:CR=1 FL=1